MASENRQYCPTCGRVAVKPRRGLTSVEYRRLVRECTSLQDLSNLKDKLVAIIKNVGKNRDFTQFFEKALENLINEEDPEGERFQDDLSPVKKWLYEQINDLPSDSGEKALYQFLQTKYPDGINEPFFTFYKKFAEGGGTMNKNYVSRALTAIGIKSKMSRIEEADSRGVLRWKSTMFLQESADDLHEIFSRIGY